MSRYVEHFWENTRVDKRGFQVCRACHVADQRLYLERRAA